MIKKTMAALLTVLLLGVTALVTVTAHAADSALEAARFLAEIGILSEAKPEDATVTRGEFASMVAALRGASMDVGAGQFSDVPADHPHAKGIGNAVAFGLMAGYTADKFLPDDAVTLNEAVRALVNLMEYKVRAKSMGGTDSDYLTTAMRAGILDKVDTSSALTAGGVYQMLRNAADTPLLIQVSYGEQAEYVSYQDRTPLTEYLKIYTYEGVVTANRYTSLSGAAGLKTEQIEIDGQIIEAQGKNADVYLGYSVRAYVRRDDKADTDTLVYIEAPESKNHVRIIEAPDIDGDNPQFGMLTIYAITGERQTSERFDIDEEAAVIYNGKYDPGFTADTFRIEEGYLKLVDTTGDSQFDVVYVNETVNYVVESVSAYSGVVQDKYGRRLELDDQNGKRDILIRDENANAVALADISQGSILTAQESKDGSYVSIVVSTRKISGFGEERGTYGGYESITVDGVEYTFASSYTALPDAYLPSVGETITASLDAAGRIADCEVGASDGMEYAVLCDVGESGSSIDPVLMVKFFTKDGIQVYNLADRVTLNGASKTMSKAAEREDVENALIKNELYRFSLNGEGELKKLETYVDYSAVTNYEGYDNLHFSLDYSSGGVPIKYRGGNLKMFASRYMVDNNTMVFYVPNDPAATEDDYNVYNGSSFFVQDQEYNVELYDISEEFKIKVVLLSAEAGGGDAANISYSSSIMVVDRITRAVSQDTESYKVYGQYNGAATEVLAYSDDLSYTDDSGKVIRVGDLKQGDIIQYALNAKGEMRYLRVIHQNVKDAPRYEKMLPTGTVTENNVYAEFYAGFGTVTNKFKSNMIISCSENIQDIKGKRNVPISAANVYLVDSKTQSVKKVTADDIEKDDTVFVRINYTNTRDVIIYR